MEFFRIRRDIPFMRYAVVLNVISALTFAAAVFFIATRGLHFSVEFTGGTLVEVAYPQTAELSRVRETVDAMKLGDIQVQNFGSSRDVLIRLPARGDLKQADALSRRVFDELCKAERGSVTTQQLTTDKGEAISKPVCGTLGSELVKLQRSEFVGPSVGSELARDGALALAVTVIGIMLYLAFRFEWKFSVAGIVANLHDVIIIVGFFAFFQWEFSLAVLAAVLAVLGYSVNESVVVFDRIRENLRKMRKTSIPDIIDSAITTTMSRTIITHAMTQMMVLSMLFLGGEALHNFALALTIGILFGIYSSVLVASPIVMWLGIRREDMVKPEKKTNVDKVMT